jgi:acetolactate decarboxylase
MTQRTMQTTANLKCFIPRALETSLTERAKTTGLPVDHLVTSFHTLFQVSTSGSLVAGVFDGAVSVEELLHHGDFGLGTLAGLDGEMVVLDGTAYQARGNGSVRPLPGDSKAPFAVITAFVGESSRQIEAVSSFAELAAACDPARASQNLFYALRVDGHFEHVHTRAINPAPPGAITPRASLRQIHSRRSRWLRFASPPICLKNLTCGKGEHRMRADRVLDRIQTGQ